MAMEGPHVRDVGISLIDGRGPRPCSNDMTREPVAAMQKSQERRQHDHVAEPAEEEDGRAQRRNLHIGLVNGPAQTYEHARVCAAERSTGLCISTRSAHHFPNTSSTEI